MARSKFQHVPENALRRRDIQIAEVRRERRRVERLVEFRSCEQGFQLRPKAHQTVAVIDKQRLDAEPIAYQREFSATRIPHRDRKHPDETPDGALDSPLVKS